MIEINWFLLITQMVTFLAAMAIVWKLFWGPLTQFMRERSEKIAADLKRSEEGRREIETLEAEYRHRLGELEEKAQHEIKDALDKGQLAKEQLIEEARLEAKRIMEKTKIDLGVERERVIRELRSYMTQLSLQAVERLLGQSLDPKTQQRLLDQFLDDIKSTRPVA